MFVLVICLVLNDTGFPLGLGEKSGNFEQTGKVWENHTKYWKFQGLSDKYYLLFLVIFK